VVVYGRTVNRITRCSRNRRSILVPDITAPLMGNYGAADAGIPVEGVRKLEEALKQNNK
jgi:hypothetical protein